MHAVLSLTSTNSAHGQIYLPGVAVLFVESKQNLYYLKGYSTLKRQIKGSV